MALFYGTRTEVYASGLGQQPAQSGVQEDFPNIAVKKRKKRKKKKEKRKGDRLIK